MTDTEIIDIILEKLYNNAAQPCTYLKSTILNPRKISIDKNHLSRIILILVSKGLAIDNSEKSSRIGDPCLKIGPLGLEIISKYGTYSSYLHSQSTDKEIILQTLSRLKQFNGFTQIELIFNEVGITDNLTQQHILDILAENKLIKKSNYSEWQVQITEVGRRLNNSLYDSLFSINNNNTTFIHNETVIGDKVTDSSIQNFKPVSNQIIEPVQSKNKNRGKIAAFLYDPWVIGIGTGLAVALIIYLISLSKIISYDDFQQPLIELEAYKIEAENNTYPAIDTLVAKVKYQGSKVILNREIKSIAYTFTDKQYFYQDQNMPSDPELNILEAFIENTIIDTLNPSQNILIQLKRKMILNGNEVAWFKEEDKKAIGKLSLTVSYKYENEIFYDTLHSDIYIIKHNELQKK